MHVLFTRKICIAFTFIVPFPKRRTVVFGYLVMEMKTETATTKPGRYDFCPPSSKGGGGSCWLRYCKGHPWERERNCKTAQTAFERLPPDTKPKLFNLCRLALSNRFPREWFILQLDFPAWVSLVHPPILYAAPSNKHTMNET